MNKATALIAANLSKFADPFRRSLAIILSSALVLTSIPKEAFSTSTTDTSGLAGFDNAPKPQSNANSGSSVSQNFTGQNNATPSISVPGGRATPPPPSFGQSLMNAAKAAGSVLPNLLKSPLAFGDTAERYRSMIPEGTRINDPAAHRVATGNAQAGMLNEMAYMRANMGSPNSASWMAGASNVHDVAVGGMEVNRYGQPTRAIEVQATPTQEQWVKVQKTVEIKGTVDSIDANMTEAAEMALQRKISIGNTGDNAEMTAQAGLAEGEFAKSAKWLKTAQDSVMKAQKYQAEIQNALARGDSASAEMQYEMMQAELESAENLILMAGKARTSAIENSDVAGRVYQTTLRKMEEDIARAEKISPDYVAYLKRQYQKMLQDYPYQYLIDQATALKKGSPVNPAQEGIINLADKLKALRSMPKPEMGAMASMTAWFQKTWQSIKGASTSVLQIGGGVVLIVVGVVLLALPDPSAITKGGGLFAISAGLKLFSNGLASNTDATKLDDYMAAEERSQNASANQAQAEARMKGWEENSVKFGLDPERAKRLSANLSKLSEATKSQLVQWQKNGALEKPLKEVREAESFASKKIDSILGDLEKLHAARHGKASDVKQLAMSLNEKFGNFNAFAKQFAASNALSKFNEQNDFVRKAAITNAGINPNLASVRSVAEFFDANGMINEKRLLREAFGGNKDALNEFRLFNGQLNTAALTSQFRKAAVFNAYGQYEKALFEATRQSAQARLGMAVYDDKFSGFDKENLLPLLQMWKQSTKDGNSFVMKAFNTGAVGAGSLFGMGLTPVNFSAGALSTIVGAGFKTIGNVFDSGDMKYAGGYLQTIGMNALGASVVGYTTLLPTDYASKDGAQLATYGLAMFDNGREGEYNALTGKWVDSVTKATIDDSFQQNYYGRIGRDLVAKGQSGDFESVVRNSDFMGGSTSLVGHVWEEYEKGQSSYGKALMVNGAAWGVMAAKTWADMAGLGFSSSGLNALKTALAAERTSTLAIRALEYANHGIGMVGGWHFGSGMVTSIGELAQGISHGNIGESMKALTHLTSTVAGMGANKTFNARVIEGKAPQVSGYKGLARDLLLDTARETVRLGLETVGGLAGSAFGTPGGTLLGIIGGGSFGRKVMAFGSFEGKVYDKAADFAQSDPKSASADASARGRGTLAENFYRAIVKGWGNDQVDAAHKRVEAAKDSGTGSIDMAPSGLCGLLGTVGRFMSGAAKSDGLKVDANNAILKRVIAEEKLARDAAKEGKGPTLGERVADFLGMGERAVDPYGRILDIPTTERVALDAQSTGRTEPAKIVEAEKAAPDAEKDPHAGLLTPEFYAKPEMAVAALRLEVEKAQLALQADPNNGAKAKAYKDSTAKAKRAAEEARDIALLEHGAAILKTSGLLAVINEHLSPEVAVRGSESRAKQNIAALEVHEKLAGAMEKQAKLREKMNDLRIAAEDGTLPYSKADAKAYAEAKAAEHRALAELEAADGNALRGHLIAAHNQDIEKLTIEVGEAMARAKDAAQKGESAESTAAYLEAQRKQAEVELLGKKRALLEAQQKAEASSFLPETSKAVRNAKTDLGNQEKLVEISKAREKEHQSKVALAEADKAAAEARGKAEEGSTSVRSEELDLARELAEARKSEAIQQARRDTAYRRSLEEDTFSARRALKKAEKALERASKDTIDAQTIKGLRDKAASLDKAAEAMAEEGKLSAEMLASADEKVRAAAEAKKNEPAKKEEASASAEPTPQDIQRATAQVLHERAVARKEGRDVSADRKTVDDQVMRLAKEFAEHRLNNNGEEAPGQRFTREDVTDAQARAERVIRDEQNLNHQNMRIAVLTAEQKQTLPLFRIVGRVKLGLAKAVAAVLLMKAAVFADASPVNLDWSKNVAEQKASDASASRWRTISLEKEIQQARALRDGISESRQSKATESAAVRRDAAKSEAKDKANQLRKDLAAGRKGSVRETLKKAGIKVENFEDGNLKKGIKEFEKNAKKAADIDYKISSTLEAIDHAKAVGDIKGAERLSRQLIEKSRNDEAWDRALKASQQVMQGEIAQKILAVEHTRAGLQKLSEIEALEGKKDLTQAEKDQLTQLKTELDVWLDHKDVKMTIDGLKDMRDKFFGEKATFEQIEKALDKESGGDFKAFVAARMKEMTGKLVGRGLMTAEEAANIEKTGMRGFRSWLQEKGPDGKKGRFNDIQTNGSLRAHFDAIRAEIGRIASPKERMLMARLFAEMATSGTLPFSFKASQDNGVSVLGRLMNMGVEAGGGKTEAFMAYQIAMRVFLGELYRGEGLVENSSAANKYENRETIKKMAAAAGLEVVDASALHAAHNTKALIEALENPNVLVIMDPTTRGHLMNMAVKDPKLRWALQESNVIFYDEVHMAATSRTSAIIGAETRAPDRSLVSSTRRLYNELEARIKFNSDFKVAFVDSKEARDALLDAWNKQGVEGLVRFKTDIAASDRLLTNLEARGHMRGDIRSVAMVLTSQKGAPGAYALTWKDGKEVIIPVDEYGRYQMDQISNDIVGQIAVALKEGKDPFKTVRVQNTEMQTGLSGIVENIYAMQVGGSATIDGLGRLLMARIGTKTVGISMSGLNLDVDVLEGVERANLRKGSIRDNFDLNTREGREAAAAYMDEKWDRKGNLVIATDDVELIKFYKERFGTDLVIDGSTTDANVNRIAATESGGKVIIINPRAYTGVDFQMHATLFVLRAETLSEQILVQLMKRINRPNPANGIRWEASRHLLMSNSTALQEALRYVVENKASLEAVWKVEKNQLALDSLKKVVLDAQEAGPNSLRDMMDLVARARQTEINSEAAKFVIQESLRTEYLIEPIKAALSQLKPGTAAYRVLREQLDQLINTRTGGNRYAPISKADYETQTKDQFIKQAFNRVMEEMAHVQARLESSTSNWNPLNVGRDLSRVSRLVERIRRDLSDLREAVNDYDNIAPWTERSLAAAVTGRARVGVMKSLVLLVMDGATAKTPDMSHVAAAQKAWKAVQRAMRVSANEATSPAAARSLMAAIAQVNMAAIPKDNRYQVFASLLLAETPAELDRMLIALADQVNVVGGNHLAAAPAFDETGNRWQDLRAKISESKGNWVDDTKSWFRDPVKNDAMLTARARGLLGIVSAEIPKDVNAGDTVTALAAQALQSLDRLRARSPHIVRDVLTLDVINRVGALPSKPGSTPKKAAAPAPAVEPLGGETLFKPAALLAAAPAPAVVETPAAAAESTAARDALVDGVRQQLRDIRQAAVDAPPVVRVGSRLGLVTRGIRNVGGVIIGRESAAPDAGVVIHVKRLTAAGIANIAQMIQQAGTSSGVPVKIYVSGPDADVIRKMNRGTGVLILDAKDAPAMAGGRIARAWAAGMARMGSTEGVGIPPVERLLELRAASQSREGRMQAALSGKDPMAEYAAEKMRFMDYAKTLAGVAHLLPEVGPRLAQLFKDVAEGVISFEEALDRYASITAAEKEQLQGRHFGRRLGRPIAQGKEVHVDVQGVGLVDVVSYWLRTEKLKYSNKWTLQDQQRVGDEIKAFLASLKDAYGTTAVDVGNLAEAFKEYRAQRLAASQQNLDPLLPQILGFASLTLSDWFKGNLEQSGEFRGSLRMDVLAEISIVNALRAAKAKAADFVIFSAPPGGEGLFRQVLSRLATDEKLKPLVPARFEVTVGDAYRNYTSDMAALNEAIENETKAGTPKYLQHQQSYAAKNPTWKADLFLIGVGIASLGFLAFGFPIATVMAYAAPIQSLPSVIDMVQQKIFKKPAPTIAYSGWESKLRSIGKFGTLIAFLPKLAGWATGWAVPLWLGYLAFGVTLGSVPAAFSASLKQFMNARNSSDPLVSEIVPPTTPDDSLTDALIPQPRRTSFAKIGAAAIATLSLTGLALASNNANTVGNSIPAWLTGVAEMLPVVMLVSAIVILIGNTGWGRRQLNRINRAAVFAVTA